MIDIKFTCNLCGEFFVRTDGKAKAPVGWGTVRPQLRVNYPESPTYNPKRESKESKAYWKFKELCEGLKKQLMSREYHLCHNCLRLKQKELLQIEKAKVSI